MVISTRRNARFSSNAEGTDPELAKGNDDRDNQEDNPEDQDIQDVPEAKNRVQEREAKEQTKMLQ